MEIKMEKDWYIVSLKAHFTNEWEHWAAFKYHSDAEKYAESYSKVRPMRIEAHKDWLTPYEYENGKQLPVILDDGPTIRVNGRTAKKVKKSNAN
jgi:hypothetical protein